MKILPTHKLHAIFEAEVKEYLSDNYYVGEATYHSVLAPEHVSVLQNYNDPTSSYVRNRADRIATHKTKPISFEYDCKTNSNAKHMNLAIELMPLVYHVNNSLLYRTKSLFLFKDFNNKLEIGFWSNAIPKVSVINIPNRYDDQQIKIFMEISKNTFPGITPRITEHRYGSGDPYVLFNYNNIHKLTHWKGLIDDITCK